MLVMSLMVFGHVLGRYVLHTSFSYTEELVRYFFVWTTFLGSAAAVARKRHLSVAGSAVFITGRLKKAAEILTFAGALVFSALLAVWGFKIVYLQYSTSQTTAAVGMPMWIVGLAVPAGAVLIVVRLFLPAVPGDVSDADGETEDVPALAADKKSGGLTGREGGR